MLLKPQLSAFVANDDESPSDSERYRCRTARVVNQRQTRPGGGSFISQPSSAIPHLTDEDPDEPESTRENRKHDIEEKCEAAVLLLHSHSYDDLSRSYWCGNDAESGAATRRFHYRPMRIAPRPHITSTLFGHLTRCLTTSVSPRMGYKTMTSRSQPSPATR